NYNNDRAAVFYAFAAASVTGGAATVTFDGTGGNHLGFPKAVLRFYRNVNTSTPFDATATATTPSGTSTSLQIPALSATAMSNEFYVGFWSEDELSGNLSV